MDIGIDGPDQVFSLAAALVIIPIIVAHLKPALRRFWPLDGPWELIADIVGVLWVLGIWQAGQAPDWVGSPFAAVMLGIVVGILSGQARDAFTQQVQPRLSQPPTQSIRAWNEPVAPAAQE